MGEGEVAIAAIVAAGLKRREADAEEVAAVATARSAGVSWLTIADALGVRQPNAVKKFLPRLRQRYEVRPLTLVSPKST